MIWPATPGLLCGGGLHVDQLQGHDLDTTLGVLVPMTNRWIALLPRMRDNEESLISLMYVHIVWPDTSKKSFSIV